jgi:hypothetical protein
MRQYLYLFWALVIGGMVLLTAVYPPCPQYASSRYYQVYDTNGNLTCVSANPPATGKLYKF